MSQPRSHKVIHTKCQEMKEKKGKVRRTHHIDYLVIISQCDLDMDDKSWKSLCARIKRSIPRFRGCSIPYVPIGPGPFLQDDPGTSLVPLNHWTIGTGRTCPAVARVVDQASGFSVAGLGHLPCRTGASLCHRGQREEIDAVAPGLVQ